MTVSRMHQFGTWLRTMFGVRQVIPEVRVANVYRRGDRLFVCASSVTTEGFWIEQGPAAVVPLGQEAELERSILESIARSRSGVRAPRNWSSWRNPILDAASFKRYSAFAKHAALVAVEQKGDALRAIPHRNGGSVEGFVGLPGQVLALGSDADTLAELIKLAMQRCC